MKTKPARIGSRVHRDTRRSRAAAFTLIEMIGVLAILAILVAIMVPPMLKSLDHHENEIERTNMVHIAEAFQQAVMRTKIIPDHTGWAQLVRDEFELATPLNEITHTRRKTQRVFLIDPALQIAGGGLPYIQTTNGSSRPMSARLIILSSTAGELPAIGTNQFNTIWNTSEREIPPGWVWAGNAEDLHIARVYLDTLFHRLILNNVDLPRIPMCSLDGSLPSPISTNSPALDRFYLEGTVVGLHDTNGIVDVREILDRSISYFFELNTWRGGISEGDGGTNGVEFAEAVDEFLALPRNPKAKFGSTQGAVIDEMYTYMFVYALWADTCFDHYGSVNLPQVPQYNSLLQAQTRLNEVTRDLINISGN